MEDLSAQVLDAAGKGMIASLWAGRHPDKVAVHNPDGSTRTFGEINANANRIVRLLRQHGVGDGDSVALISSNRHEFIEVMNATQRAGIRFTPINWHLTTDEIAYIIDNCEAKAVFAEGRQPTAKAAVDQSPNLKLKVAIGAPMEGFVQYDEALAGLDGSDIDDPVLGNQMLYTSGTTGRPKGVSRAVNPAAAAVGYGMRGYDDSSVQLCAGPAYHAAPLAFDIRASILHGTPVVLWDKWDSEGILRTIQEKRVTHMHLVPIMFQRLLSLPDEVRQGYDVSSLSYIVHGAAPCPPEVKHAMIDWVGPILSEYYAGSEGGAGFTITSEEWLKKPGSVGKRPALLGSKIIAEDGSECPPGVPGTIYHQLPPGGGFTYYKDEAKTQGSRLGDYFTMGDVGYYDEDDYLFLTGRNAETIISGGVNIYPQEIDNELIKHDAVADSATVGVPNPEWGEEVRAVILLEPGYEPTDDLKAEILGFAKANLPGYKVPRNLDFVTDLPRSEAGKIQRNKVRAPYWEGRARAI